MPTYQYACTSCGERLEAVQKFTDDPLTVCPACAGALRKLFSPVGVVFKGSGFYKTDSRTKTSTSSGSATKDDGAAKEKPPAESKGDGSTAKPADKPAAQSKPAASTGSSTST